MGTFLKIIFFLLVFPYVIPAYGRKSRKPFNKKEKRNQCELPLNHLLHMYVYFHFTHNFYSAFTLNVISSTFSISLEIL